jgi:hypothetical protein
VITGRYFEGEEARAAAEAYDLGYRARLGDLTRRLPAS